MDQDEHVHVGEELRGRAQEERGAMCGSERVGVWSGKACICGAAWTRKPQQWWAAAWPGCIRAATWPWKPLESRARTHTHIGRRKKGKVAPK